MRVTADLRASCPPEALFAWVDDLDRYPPWMELVHRVEPAGTDAQGRPAWQVELRARLGPMSRSKRLRMVRTVHEPHSLAVFERDEDDGRRHALWSLRAEVAADGGASRLDVELLYGGTLWTGGLLERALADQIERGRERLQELVSEPRR